MSTVAADARVTIHAYFDAMDAGDFDQAVGFFDENVIYERPGYEPIRGNGQLLHFFTKERVIASGHHDIKGILVEGDQAVAWGGFTGQSRTGSELSESWCDVYEFRNSRIHRRRTYFFRPAV